MTEYRRVSLRTKGGRADEPAEAVAGRFPRLEFERRAQQVERIGTEQTTVEHREAEAGDVGRRRQQRAASLNAAVVRIVGVLDAVGRIAGRSGPVEARGAGHGAGRVV